MVETITDDRGRRVAVERVRPPRLPAARAEQERRRTRLPESRRGKASPLPAQGSEPLSCLPALKAELEKLAGRVRRLTVSAADPHRFYEERSEIARDIGQAARRLPG